MEPPTEGRLGPLFPADYRFLANWPRYRIERLLGTGGMGTVFRAFDPSLNRRVALKFLHRNDEVQVERFLREAQAQARVEHPHLCQVHEVGEVEGRPYIAMQYIEGRSLSELRGRIAPELAVRLVRDVARAVHAAHRTGLIHRDLKPANILVATGEAGEHHPYVVDFGLAQDQGDAALTRTGVITGTPAYLSPEQAQGLSLDRRTDVYSLGIVLYELLAGSPPFAGPNPASTLVRVIQEDPVPLRKLAPAVAADLGTIIHKCIEKNPDRRYESARALADDLDRWLDGEPIEARPASWSYRAGKRLRKNRALAVVTATAIVALLVLGAAIVRTRWQARERAALAQRFGQRVTEIGWRVRAESLLPKHDVTASKRALRSELDEIRREMEHLGPIAVGPGHWALGQAYLALGQPEPARSHLEKAWNAGERNPEVAAALGRALGLVYEKALVDASSSRGDARKDARQEMGRTYRQPALARLEEAYRDRSQQTPYIAALIAFYKGRYEEAVRKASQAAHRDPLLYEAVQLEAEAWASRADDLAAEGRSEEALLSFDRAGGIYGKLLSIVPSNAPLHAGECWRQIRRIGVLSNLGRFSLDEEDSALAACDQALEVDPELADALSYQAWLLYGRADRKQRTGTDPRPGLVDAMRRAERALAVQPRLARAHKTIAACWRLQGQWEADHGADPVPAYQRSIAAAQQTIELEPEVAPNYNELGLTRLRLARDQDRRGLDPRPVTRQAIAAWDRSLAVSPGYFQALSNQGAAWSDIAEYHSAHGLDPSEATRNAVSVLGHALQVNPERPSAYNNLGNSHLILAEYLTPRGGDPRPDLRKAADSFQEAVNRFPDYGVGIYNLAYTHRSLAEALRARGEDPSAEVRTAESHVDRYIGLNPDDADGFLERARIHLVAARWALGQKRDPDRAFQEAEEDLRKAAALNPGSPDIYLAQAQVCRYRAEGTLARGGRPEADLREGIARTGKALAINPDESNALALQGLLQRLAAGLEADPSRRRVRLDEAAASLRKALAANPLLAREYGSVVQK